MKKLALFASIFSLATLATFPAVAEVKAEEVISQATPQETSTPVGNIVQVASSNDSFDTLVAAVQAANLVDTLSSPGPYTVFAPTDAAFAALPEGALEVLLKPENRNLLVKVLSYHVVSGEVKSTQLRTGRVQTLGGGIAVRVSPNRVIVNGGSVVLADVDASNGVVHAINTVLMPRSLRNQIVSLVNAR
ncbi:MAG: fasciclin domain-containing protein [Spirulinaceae cyanobacterium]